MSQRTLINIVLLTVVAGLAVFIAFAPERERRVELEPLSNGNPRDVSHVRLEPGTGEAIELRRAEDAWRLVDPIRIAANDFRVNALLGVLEAPVHARIDATPDNLARFGLVSPKGRIRLDDVEILFGDTEPIHGRRYLLQGGRVALVDDAYFAHLSSSAANYVEPALLGRDPSPQSIHLPNLTVYRKDGDWRMDSAERNTDSGSAGKLVDAWRNAQATAVRPYEQSLNWNEEVRVELADGDLHFDLARTEYEIIFGRPDLGIQYHMTKGTGSRLLELTPPDDAS